MIKVMTEDIFRLDHKVQDRVTVQDTFGGLGIWNVLPGATVGLDHWKHLRI